MTTFQVTTPPKGFNPHVQTVGTAQWERGQLHVHLDAPMPGQRVLILAPTRGQPNPERLQGNGACARLRLGTHYQIDVNSTNTRITLTLP